MDTQVEDISSTRKRLRIQIPREVLTDEINSAYLEIGRNAKVPGFRPGKIPRPVLEKRFDRDVRAQVLDKLVPDYYEKALKESGLRPVSMPKFESKLEIRKDEPLDMTLTVDVRPVIDKLDYKGIELDEIPVDADEDEIEKAVESIRREKATLEPTDKAGDDCQVVVDYEAFDGDELVTEVSESNFTFDLDSGDLPEEFTRETIGKKAGDSYEFSVKYPKDHPGERVAGKSILFKVHLKEIKKRVLPEMDDSFAKDLGFDDTASLRTRIEENIRGMKEMRAREINKLKVSEKLLEKHEFDLPESLLERELQIRVAEIRDKSKNDTGEGTVERSDEELRAEVMEEAEKSLKGQMLVEMIGEVEGVRVEEDDMKKKLAEISSTAGIHPEALMQYYTQNEEALKQLQGNVFEGKVLEKVASYAKFMKKESK